MLEQGDEHPDLNGISHLLEHMAFKGTKRRDAYAIAAEIEDVGGQINAYTSREHTAYFAKVFERRCTDSVRHSRRYFTTL